jgi:hypothetical protein
MTKAVSLTVYSETDADHHIAWEALQGMASSLMRSGYPTDLTAFSLSESDPADAQVVQFEPEVDIVDGAGRAVGEPELYVEHQSMPDPRHDTFQMVDDGLKRAFRGSTFDDE